MSNLCFCGWRPVMTRTMLGGIFLYSTLAISYANDKNDKGSKHNSSTATPAVERVARSERQSISQAPQVRQNSGAAQGGSRVRLPAQPQTTNGSSRFQPKFSREPQRVTPQPANIPAPSTKLPSSTLSSGKPSSVAFLQKNDKKNDKEKSPKPEPKNDPKPPKVEHPKPVKPATEVPKVVIPKVEQPKVNNSFPKVKVNPEVKVKIDPPKNPVVKQGNSDARGDDKIRIRKTPTEEPNVAGPSSPANSPNAKIKIRTPQPDLKVTLPADKSGDKNTAKIIGKNLDRGVGREIGKTVDKDVVKIIDKSIRLKDGATLTRDHQEKIKLDLDKTHRDLASKGKVALPERVKIKLPEQVKVAGTQKLQKLPREALKLPVPKNGKVDPKLVAKLNLKPAHEALNLKLKHGDFNHFTKLKSGQKFDLHKQFQFHQHGDIGRRMNLLAGLQLRGGWRHRHFGLISPVYASHCMPIWYAGPGFCSPYLWYPSWSPWVDWCWWDTCAPLYDPRPIICHPIVYDPCSPWVYWEFPTWNPLPYVACGTWVDVEPVVISSGMDLQLLATRFVDPGHPDQELGTRLRIWVRNNTPYDINQPFNVMLIASTDANAFAGLPEAGVRVPGMRAGETQAIDIRLPYAANRMGRDSAGRAIPFTYVTVLVDSHNELPESFEANNGATLIRGDILPVDPSAFAAEPSYSQPGGIIHVAGEGFGPEPGQAMVVIGDQEFQAEILGWFDLGVQIRLPDFELDTATAADLVIIRGDGAASNPLTIEINPNPATVEAVVPEAFGPELPDPPALPEPMF